MQLTGRPTVCITVELNWQQKRGSTFPHKNKVSGRLWLTFPTFRLFGEGMLFFTIYFTLKVRVSDRSIQQIIQLFSRPDSR